MEISTRANKPVIVNISNRHIHICAEDLEKLFGANYKLTKIKDLMQPGEHACQETVKIIGPKGEIDKVRILGPLRKATQVEISVTDSIKIGVNAPVRISGDVKNSAPVTIVGPQGTVNLKEGCVVAKRHIHMTPEDAKYYNINDNDLLSIKSSGERSVIFENVVARVSDKMVLECHLDIDEANAANIKNGDKVIIL